MTKNFEEWLSRQTSKIRTLVRARLDLMSLGHFGNHKWFDGLIELRWKNGTRVYFFMEKNAFVIVLVGGNKNGQSKDIRKAKKLKSQVLENAQTFFK